MFAPFLILVVTLNSGPEERALEESLKAEQFLFGEATVVSATKHEEPLIRAPSAVTVITADDLKRCGSLVEALRAVPGLDVQINSPANTVLTIRRTGEGSFSTLILIDGRKITIDLLGGSFIELLPVSLDDIERIEVIRGPGSALYGAALNGIINIITKDPKQTEGFLFRTARGNYSTWEATARSAGGAGEALRYRVTSSWDTTNSREEDIVAKNSLQATAKLLHDVSPRSTLELQSGADRTIVNNPGMAGSESIVPFAFLHWGIRGEGQELHAQASYSHSDATIFFPQFEMLKDIFSPFLGSTFSGVDFTKIPVRANTYDGEAYYSPFINLYHNRLTLGAQLRYSDARSPIEAHGILKETTASGYAQEEYSPTDFLTILLGGRYDYNSVSRPAFSPRLSLICSPVSGHSIRASYGESFRKPSFLESQFKLAGLSDKPVTVFGNTFLFPLSNANLRNQKNTSFEVGYQGMIRRARIFLDVFSSTMSDKFIWKWTQTAPATYSFQLDNDPKSYSYYGLEAGGEVMAVPHWVRVSGAYSVVQGDDIGGLPGPYRGTRQKISAEASLTLPQGITLALQGHYVDKRTVEYTELTLIGVLVKGLQKVTLPSYVLLNAAAWYTVRKPSLDVGLRLFNLLDTDAHDYPRLYAPGVGYYGGERLSRTIEAFARVSF